MIQFKEVSKSFDHVEALREISLQIDSGELMLLTGSSGAGKTTLLQLLLAALRPDAGTIEVDGTNITKLRHSAIPYLRRNFGVVFQDFKLLRKLTALHNVRLALEIRGVARALADREVHRTLSALGLDRLAFTPVHALSGGEQQRVAIARALAGDPQIVLADEPTGSLDPRWAQDILWLLNRLSRRGTTVVVATHDPTLVAGADYTQCARLEQGRIVEVVRRSRDTPQQPQDDGAEETDGTATEPPAP